MSSFRLISVLLFSVLIGNACAKEQKETEKEEDLKYKLILVEEFPVKELAEPSGLAWAARRGTLFAVGDEGSIAEISTGGEILNMGLLAMRDLEGVAFDPETSDLYVLDESANSLILLDPDSLTLKDELVLDAVSKGPFEGLEMDSQRTFYFSEQKAKEKGAGVLILSRNDKPWVLETGIRDQSAIMVIDDLIYILSDSDDRLYCLDREGTRLWDCKVKGNMQEGLAMDDEGYIYIAQDSGGILKMKLERKDEKK